ncbi:MAG: zinc dependent phospholipase C family protein [Methanobacteriota archaeon]|nr:MAG: zinc dependent phospholipase C family protein [Euryarchaeota archaeon]
MADMALALQTRDVFLLSKTYHAEFLFGTEAPDHPSYFCDHENHHVYFNKSGGIQDDIGAIRASDMYKLVVGAIDTRSLSQAAFYLGAMAHYIGDIGVFGHTMGADTDWGSEVHHADYEEAVDSMFSSLDEPLTIGLGNKDPYNATLDLAKDITFGTSNIKANKWMDDWYSWSNSTFRTSAIASLHASVGAVAAAFNYTLTEREIVMPSVEELLANQVDEFLKPLGLVPLVPQKGDQRIQPVEEPLIQNPGPSVTPTIAMGIATSIAVLATASMVILFSWRVSRRS